MKFFLTWWVALFLSLSSAATPALFSEEEQSVILAFPTQNGSLQWGELQKRVDNADHSLLSFPDAYISALVSLRTGNSEQAVSILPKLEQHAGDPKSTVLFEHLKAFIAFYTSEPVERYSQHATLLERVQDYEENSLKADWLAGTSLTLLTETARNNSDPLLSAEAIELAKRILPEPRDFDTTAWLLSAHIKGAYTAALQSDSNINVTATYFLLPALAMINDMNVSELSNEESQIIRSTYFRLHAINVAESSRLATRDIKGRQIPLPIIDRYHSDFQNECVVKIRTVSNRITSTGYFGTGGFVFRLSVNRKGRVSFQELIDAQPVRLKKMDMERVYKDIAKRLRIDIDNEKPECQNGGELILPYSLSTK